MPKPYHGIRIYLSEGSNRFEEVYLFPMYGCSKSMAADFDHDGDLDIAGIAFYDNTNHPTKGFVYLENSGNLDYTAHYMDQAAYGKWLTMDLGDFDNDGYTDIFLGSYFHNIQELSTRVSPSGEHLPQVLWLSYKK